jgi:nitrate reductase NapE component
LKRLQKDLVTSKDTELALRHSMLFWLAVLVCFPVFLCGFTGAFAFVVFFLLVTLEVTTNCTS